MFQVTTSLKQTTKRTNHCFRSPSSHMAKYWGVVENSTLRKYVSLDWGKIFCVEQVENIWECCWCGLRISSSTEKCWVGVWCQECAPAQPPFSSGHRHQCTAVYSVTVAWCAPLHCTAGTLPWYFTHYNNGSTTGHLITCFQLSNITWHQSTQFFNATIISWWSFEMDRIEKTHYLTKGNERYIQRSSLSYGNFLGLHFSV